MEYDYFGIISGLITRKQITSNESGTALSLVELGQKQLEGFTKFVSNLEQKYSNIDQAEEPIVDLETLTFVEPEEIVGHEQITLKASTPKIMSKVVRHTRSTTASKRARQTLALPDSNCGVQYTNPSKTAVQAVTSYIAPIRNLLFDHEFQINALNNLLNTLKFDDRNGETREFLIEKAFKTLGLKMLPSPINVHPIVHFDGNQIKITFTYDQPSTPIKVMLQSFFPNEILSLSRQIYDILLDPNNLNEEVSFRSSTPQGIEDFNDDYDIEEEDDDDDDDDGHCHDDSGQYESGLSKHIHQQQKTTMTRIKHIAASKRRSTVDKVSSTKKARTSTSEQMDLLPNNSRSIDRPTRSRGRPTKFQ